MTIEERAEQALKDLAKVLWNINRDAVIHSDDALEKIKQPLRDQIEDCAKVADQFIGGTRREIAKAIRALATSAETESEVER